MLYPRGIFLLDDLPDEASFFWPALIFDIVISFCALLICLWVRKKECEKHNQMKNKVQRLYNVLSASLQRTHMDKLAIRHCVWILEKLCLNYHVMLDIIHSRRNISEENDALVDLFRQSVETQQGLIAASSMLADMHNGIVPEERDNELTLETAGGDETDDC